ncbi:hypothetical protein G6F32_015970 [Rhizopus arrhizus]|nr:hypothetical protein G6F32_015970 [Rhizopus arrhizus]
MIPHVTQFEQADITDLEGLRVALNKENEKAGIKLTMLAFLIKASAAALKKFPEFNASLDASGENLTLKKSRRKPANWPRRRATASWARPT